MFLTWIPLTREMIPPSNESVYKPALELYAQVN